MELDFINRTEAEWGYEAERVKTGKINGPSRQLGREGAKEAFLLNLILSRFEWQITDSRYHRIMGWQEIRVEAGIGTYKLFHMLL